jgi:hypothetical protein
MNGGDHPRHFISFLSAQQVLNLIVPELHLPELSHHFP